MKPFWKCEPPGESKCEGAVSLLGLCYHCYGFSLSRAGVSLYWYLKTRLQSGVKVLHKIKFFFLRNLIRGEISGFLHVQKSVGACTCSHAPRRPAHLHRRRFRRSRSGGAVQFSSWGPKTATPRPVLPPSPHPSLPPSVTAFCRCPGQKLAYKLVPSVTRGGSHYIAS